MAKIGGDWVLLFTCSALFGVITFYQSDGQTLLRVALKSLFVFGILTFVIQFLSPPICAFFDNRKKKEISSKYRSFSHEELKERHERSRRNIEEIHSAKTATYNEEILKPREETRKSQKEKEFYKFMGPAWKGPGAKLGTSDEGNDGNETKKSGTSRDAAQARKSLDCVVNPSAIAADQSKKKTKKIIQLPEEPVEGTADSITVALRTPLGKTFKRRFLTSEKIQVLLDYMTTVGYTQRLYTVAMSYPRQCLSSEAEKTLSDLGIHRDIVMNVEEKDWDELESE